MHSWTTRLPGRSQLTCRVHPAFNACRRRPLTGTMIKTGGVKVCSCVVIDSFEEEEERLGDSDGGKGYPESLLMTTIRREVEGSMRKNKKVVVMVTSKCNSSSKLGLKSSRIIFIHNPSHIPCAMAQNSASALDRATTFCFLLLQVTRFLPKIIHYPKVDLLSTTDPA
ncbi:hypothetical protein CR513_30240, partial [Mucuna pruriens]